VTSYGQRVLALLERNPEAFMVSLRDGRDHVLTVHFHGDFVLGVNELDLRMAILSMPRHARKVWLAAEVGYLEDAEVVGGALMPLERIVDPLDHEEIAEWYGYARGTVETYLSQARRHLEERLDRPRVRARPPWHKVGES
jgi:glyoxylase-like metal-dependent hydrolase (beta-lactamase superfamily II)